MGLDGALGVAAGGLSNVSFGLSVISQNIANASTPQYALESATQTSLAAGGQGFGVQSGIVIRATDPSLQGQVAAQAAATAAADTTSSALATLEPVLGTVGGGTDLGSRVAAVQAAFTTLQADPGDAPAQQAVVQAAATLAAGLNQLSGAYTTARQTAQDGVVSGVAQLNTALATVGSLSRRIISQRAQGLSTADLENQRAQAEAGISQLVDARFLDQPNGGVTVLTAGGVQLSTDGQTTLSVAPATTGPQVFHAGAGAPGGGIGGIMLGGVDVTAQMTGGSIGANITLRDATLPSYQAGLDEFAEGLSTRFAAQGLTLFTDPAGAVPAATGPLAQSGYVGYAATIGVNPAVTATPGLVRDGTQAVAGAATGASAFTPNPAGGPAGFATLIGRVLQYALGSQAQDGVGQPALATTGLGPGGTLQAASPSGADLLTAANALTAGQAGDSAQATAETTDARATGSSLQAMLTASTGVDMNTQLGNMVVLENAFGANAKIIAALETMYTALLAMVT